MRQADGEMLQSLPIVRIPNSHTGIQASSRDSPAVKCNGVNLTEMTMKGPQTLALGDAPDPCCRVVASGRNQIAVDLDTSDARLVAHKNMFAVAP